MVAIVELDGFLGLGGAGGPDAPPGAALELIDLAPELGFACDPDEVTWVLQQLLGEPSAPVVAYSISAGPATPRETPKPAAPEWKVATDARSGSVIVRGRAEHIELATELISIVEQPPGKPLPKTKLIQAIELKQAAAEEVWRLTERLELRLRAVALPEMKMVIAAGSEEDLAAWSKLARDLDVPERKIDGNNMRRLGVLRSPPVPAPPARPVAPEPLILPPALPNVPAGTSSVPIKF